MGDVKFFSYESPYEVRSARNRLIKQQQELHSGILAAQDWADFKFRLGKLAGITDAINILDESVKEREDR